MKIHDIQQGTPEWHELRAKHFTASEAVAMMGASPYQTRQQLLHEKATGESEEINPAKQALFNKGHQAEAAMRPVIEKNICDDLYPATVSNEIDGLPLLASLDGMTMDGTTLYEHKLWNQGLANTIEENGTIPETHYWQLEHQLLVSEAESVVFVVSDGTEENLVMQIYLSDPERRQKLILGWHQFAKDLGDYTPQVEQEKPEAKPIMALPELVIAVAGSVTQSNLDVYKSEASKFIAAINTNLATDQDFADAEANIKFCSEAEKSLDDVKRRALSQTEEIDNLFRTVDHLKNELRSKRLDLEKLVKAQKQIIRNEIVQKAVDAIKEHASMLNTGLAPYHLPGIDIDIQGAMKNKRTLSSLKDAALGEVTRAQIEYARLARIIQSNKKLLEAKAGDLIHLFPDAQQHIANEYDDLFTGWIDSRLAEHRANEEKRREKEQIKQAEISNPEQTTAIEKPESNVPQVKPRVRVETPESNPEELLAVLSPVHEGYDLWQGNQRVGFVQSGVLNGRTSITVYKNLSAKTA